MAEAEETRAAWANYPPPCSFHWRPSASVDILGLFGRKVEGGESLGKRGGMAETAKTRAV